MADEKINPRTNKRYKEYHEVNFAAWLAAAKSAGATTLQLMTKTFNAASDGHSDVFSVKGLFALASENAKKEVCFASLSERVEAEYTYTAAILNALRDGSAILTQSVEHPDRFRVQKSGELPSSLTAVGEAVSI